MTYNARGFLAVLKMAQFIVPLVVMLLFPFHRKFLKVRQFFSDLLSFKTTSMYSLSHLFVWLKRDTSLEEWLIILHHNKLLEVWQYIIRRLYQYETKVTLFYG